MIKFSKQANLLPLALSKALTDAFVEEARKHRDTPGLVAGWNQGFIYRCAFAHVMAGDDARDARNAVEAGIKDALAYLEMRGKAQ